jgi:hypothetical protein
MFDLNGSKAKRHEYVNINTQNYIEKKKRKTWGEILGIVKDDPNSQEIVIYLALILIFLGILLTTICCLCIYWCKERKRLNDL